jgi:TldD protein
MDRRKFIQSCSAAVPAILISSTLGKGIVKNNKMKTIDKFDDDYVKTLADTSMKIAKDNGASYSDFRLSKFRNQRISARDNNIEGVSDDEDFGFSVRLLLDGAWGFAASSTFNEPEVAKVTRIAADIAKANRKIQLKPIELTPVEVYNDFWTTPIKKNPLDVPVDEKIKLLLNIDEKAKALGADYVESFIWSINEWKYFASSEGSYIKQDLYRIWPEFDITIVDKDTGKFESRKSLTAPMGKGYEYVEEYDFMGDLDKAVEETKMKIKAKSVEPGKRDIILDSTNMWLTIHESCGHPSELDRALGYEANYAGTSFLTVDKLGKLKYGSDIVNLVADRTQKDGLATRGYDDEGVKTTRWNIINNGLFTGYQTTREMAKKINEDHSNGCAYADSWAHFPIQRMPNVSLEPGSKALLLKDLIADTEDGIYIVGDGSWSIDMQRYNFQFTGQAFHEIKNGKIIGMLRDVAYQGNTVDFWNSCDAICDATEYKLGGSLFCGKGEPGQVSPVSHGASPARFRKINILNTSKEASK